MTARPDLVLVAYEGDLESGALDPFARDRCHEPVLHWRDTLVALGYRLEQAAEQDPARVAAVLYWDGRIARFSTGTRRLKDRLRGRPLVLARDWLSVTRRRGIPVALILWEPPVVEPANWDSQLLDRFPCVITYDDDLVDGRHFQKYVNPVCSGTVAHAGPGFNQRNHVVAISGNKSSNHPAELYSARAETYSYLSARQDVTFDLYGVGWDLPAAAESDREKASAIASAYRGKVADKLDVMAGYRFGITYENATAPRGYVTEKAIDCLRAGCVPVYWGPQNWPDYIEPAAVVDRTQFISEEALADHLVGMSEPEWESMREAGRSFLGSRHFLRFLPSVFAETLNGTLGLGSR